MIYLIAIFIIWIIGAFIAYDKFISEWDNTKFERAYFSMLWPFILLFYLIHTMHNKL